MVSNWAQDEGQAITGISLLLLLLLLLLLMACCSLQEKIVIIIDDRKGQVWEVSEVERGIGNYIFVAGDSFII